MFLMFNYIMEVATVFLDQNCLYVNFWLGRKKILGKSISISKTVTFSISVMWNVWRKFNFKPCQYWPPFLNTQVKLNLLLKGNELAQWAKSALNCEKGSCFTRYDIARVSWKRELFHMIQYCSSLPDKPTNIFKYNIYLYYSPSILLKRSNQFYYMIEIKK